MLKIFTDKSALNQKNRTYVFPLLFDLWYTKSDLIRDYFCLVDSIQDCNILVVPIDYNRYIKQNPTSNFSNNLKTTKKPIWIYSAGDQGYSINKNNIYNFRFGGYNSKLNKNTFILPSFINDPYDTILKKPFAQLKKENKPTIGFVGHAQSGTFKYFKEYYNHLKYKLKRRSKYQLSDKQSFYPSSTKRANYLLQLANSKALNTMFISRKAYRAGSISVEQKQKSTLEFYENIYNNAYTFCIRGVGNFSVRFYETLAVGRIPILLNTDCRLPLEDLINWKKHCLVLNKTKSMETQIMEFHNAHSDTSFKNLQMENRKLWEYYLERLSYFIRVHDKFKSHITSNV